MIIKFKPTYKYQAAEFEIEVTEDEQSFEEAFRTYGAVLRYLKDTTDVVLPSEESQTAVELATDKQKDIMNRFHIAYTNLTTKDEASQLIKDSMSRFKK